MALNPDDSADQHRPGEAPGRDGLTPTQQLAGCFARARPVLQALVAGVDSGDALVVATDRKGFPVAQRVLRRPRDLPRALVIGRHNRCALSIPNDNRVSLRHVLLTAWPGDGPIHYRGYDLGGRAGVLLADGKRVPGFSFQSQGLISLGRTVVFVAPGGPEGVGLLDGGDDVAFRNLTGLDPTGNGVRLAMSATSEPGVAHLGGDEPREYGGYRGLDLEARPQPRGVLRLRSTKPSGRGEEVRELDLDSRQLQRGLLIGRYSDRCSLAGHGRNLSRVHALVTEEAPRSLLVYDLASTNGVRPAGMTEGPSHSVVRLTEDSPVMLGHFELAWVPNRAVKLH
ncbi:FHA domain-containing protein [Paraliomyxa miuraensis]|uniref:FHA domain-containing protein n=1 Tax=Paraliomyxa miuraensis TaxID=376150 RepID=UPI002253D5E7|nr:FHA domain-containing protein [Paraliomyxa miuraensis]MCX4239572.1 FHA domain-containing protein [Paraliomyxa miuraensis]